MGTLEVLIIGIYLMCYINEDKTVFYQFTDYQDGLLFFSCKSFLPGSFLSARSSKGLVIKYGEPGGLQNGKIAGPELFAPPPSRR